MSAPQPFFPGMKLFPTFGRNEFVGKKRNGGTAWVWPTDSVGSGSKISKIVMACMYRQPIWPRPAQLWPTGSVGSGCICPMAQHDKDVKMP